VVLATSIMMWQEEPLDYYSLQALSPANPKLFRRKI